MKSRVALALMMAGATLLSYAGHAVAQEAVAKGIVGSDPMNTLIAQIVAQTPTTGFLVLCVWKLWQRCVTLESKVFQMALRLTGPEAREIGERITASRRAPEPTA